MAENRANALGGPSFPGIITIVPQYSTDVDSKMPGDDRMNKATTTKNSQVACHYEASVLKFIVVAKREISTL